MNLTYQFRRLVFLQVLLGIVAFCMAEPNPGMLVIAGSLGFMSWYVTEGPSGRPLPRIVINFGALVALVWLVIDLRWHEGHVIITMGHFTIWLQVLLLYSEKRNREYGQLLVLSLMMMIGASVLSVSMIYGVLLMAYCVVALLALLMFHFKSTSDTVLEANRRAAGDRSRVAPPSPIISAGYRWQFRAGALLIGVCCTLAGLMVFVVMPRRPGAALPQQLEGPIAQRQIGFSQNVDLTSSPMPEGSQEPVMNVKVSQYGQPIQTDMMLLRGAALDEYDPDSRTWRRGPFVGSQSNVYMLEDDQLELATMPETARPYTATITLRRTGYRTLFTHHPTTAIRSSNLAQVSFNTLDQQVEAGESISGALVYEVQWPMQYTGDLHQRYERTLAPQRRYHQPRRSENRDDEQEIERYARGWPAHADRIAELTLSVLRDHDLDRDIGALHDPRDERIVNTLKYWLQRNFTYQMSNPRVANADDPMVEFLFNHRRGHCELFASALAAMTRSIGMQARVVTGYRVSEFNHIGRYYVVRHSHAHAWTEINLGESQGWRTVDPTPPDDAYLENANNESWTRTIRELYEHLEFTWIKSVVAYDQRTRMALLTGVNQSLRRAVNDPNHPVGRTLAALHGLAERNRLDWLTIALIAIIALALLTAVGVLIRTTVALRRRASSLRLEALPADRRRDIRKELGFYLTMTEMLERHGYHRPTWQSPLAFAEALRRADVDRFDPVWRLTDWFYQLRFGGRPMDGFRRQRVRGQLRRLEKALTNGS